MPLHDQGVVCNLIGSKLCNLIGSKRATKTASAVCVASFLPVFIALPCSCVYSIFWWNKLERVGLLTSSRDGLGYTICIYNRDGTYGVDTNLLYPGLGIRLSAGDRTFEGRLRGESLPPGGVGRLPLDGLARRLLSPFSW